VFVKHSALNRTLGLKFIGSYPGMNKRTRSQTSLGGGGRRGEKNSNQTKYLEPLPEPNKSDTMMGELFFNPHFSASRKRKVLGAQNSWLYSVHI
jgi:hypothetical protein